MKDFRDMLVASATDICKRMDVLHDWLGVAEARRIPLREKCNALSAVMGKARTEIVQRLNFGNAEIKRRTAELDVATQKRNALALKYKQFALELQSVPNLADIAKKN